MISSRKLFLISIALVFALLSFGCLQISYEQKVAADGSSVITQSIDLRGLSGLAQSVSNNSEEIANSFKSAYCFKSALTVFLILVFQFS